MTHQWFDPNLYAWIPGTLVGVVGGLLGGIVGVLASRGRYRLMVLQLWNAFTVASLCLLVAGIYALIDHQPWGVWYGLGFPGFMGTVLFGALRFVVVRAYRQVEERSILAQDL